MPPKGKYARTRQYLSEKCIPDAYQALFCGLAIMKPADPKKWIKEKLSYVLAEKIKDIEWDLFIDEHMRPKYPIGGAYGMGFFHNFDDPNQPSAEMISLALQTFTENLKRKCFNAWLQYHIFKKISATERSQGANSANSHHQQKQLRVIVTRWHKYTQYRLNRREIALTLVDKVYKTYLARLIFSSWHNVSAEARKTREYFEKELRRLERGDNVNEDDIFNIGDGETRDNLSAVPVEVQVKIFKCLNIVDLARCSQVCRSWKIAAQNSQLWSVVNVSEVKDKMPEQIFSRVLHRYRAYVRHLNLRGCDHISVSALKDVGCCGNLQDVNFSQCSQLSDDIVRVVSLGCPLLMYLNLSYTDVSDNSLRHLGEYTNNLQYLSLAYCYNISDFGIEYFTKGSAKKQLIYIDLSGCSQLSPQAFRDLAEACRGLRHWILNYMETLTDDHLKPLGQFNKQLETVQMRGVRGVSNEGLRYLSKRYLHHLYLDSNLSLSDVGIRYLMKSCTEITHLRLVDCPEITDQALKVLSGLKHLKLLNVANCVRITDAGVRHITEGSSCNQLREVNFTNCVRVGDLTPLSISKRCPQVAYLSLCYCDFFTEIGLEVLGSAVGLVYLDLTGTACGDHVLSCLGTLPCLRQLVISECVNVTDLGLQKFTQQCQNLEHLDVSMCHQLTDGAIKNLAFCSRFLSSLNVAGCRQLTDSSVQYLSGVCHFLVYLDLSACIMITEKSLNYLKNGCKKLDTLNLKYCKGIPKRSAMKISRFIPKVAYSCEDPPAIFGY